MDFGRGRGKCIFSTDKWKTTIHREIALQGELDQEQKRSPLQIVKLLPGFKKTLAGEIDILSTLK